MPFRVRYFLENLERWVESGTRDELTQACDSYASLTTPQQKARCIQGMMEVLDQEADEEARRLIMEACGRSCIGTSTLEKVRRIKQKAQNLEDLLNELNQAHIGGGYLKLDGETIQASYDHCYCGSVSKAKVPFSSTYCLCSCGWYKQLFETLFDKPVEVELQGSIIQGNERCQFLIRILEPG